MQHVHVNVIRVSRRDVTIAHMHLPAPMAPGNWEAHTDTCAFQERFKRLVINDEVSNVSV